MRYLFYFLLNITFGLFEVSSQHVLIDSTLTFRKVGHNQYFDLKKSELNGSCTCMNDTLKISLRQGDELVNSTLHFIIRKNLIPQVSYEHVSDIKYNDGPLITIEEFTLNQNAFEVGTNPLVGSYILNIKEGFIFNKLKGRILGLFQCGVSSFSSQDGELYAGIDFFVSPDKPAQLIEGIELLNQRGDQKGKVYLEILIDSLGRVSKAKVVKGINDKLNSQALNLTKKMIFTPAYHKGLPVFQKKIMLFLFEPG